MRSSTHTVDGGCAITLEGDIAEGASFSDIQVHGRRIVLQLAGVDRINSRGLNAFMDFLKRLSLRAAVEAEQCSPAVVVQLNLNPALTSMLAIGSVMVPLECPSCDFESVTPVPVAGLERAPAVEAPPCSECGAAMVVAEPEERYFAFLRM